MKKLLISTFTTFLIFMASTPHLVAQWSMDSLNSARNYAQAALVGNKAIFVNNNAEIYDIVTGAKTTKTFSVARTRISGASTPEKAWFAGGYSGPYTDPLYRKNVDIYTAATNTWTTTNLSQASVVDVTGRLGNKVFFAGGNAGGNAPASKRLDIWTDVLQLVAAPAVNEVLPASPATELMSDVRNMDFTVYPNPASGETVTLQFNSVASENMLIALIDMSGKRIREIRKTNTDNFTETIDISGLSDGIYFIAVQSNGNTWTTKKLLIQRR